MEDDTILSLIFAFASRYDTEKGWNKHSGTSDRDETVEKNTVQNHQTTHDVRALWLRWFMKYSLDRGMHVRGSARYRKLYKTFLCMRLQVKLIFEKKIINKRLGATNSRKMAGVDFRRERNSTDLFRSPCHDSYTSVFHACPTIAIRHNMGFQVYSFSVLAVAGARVIDSSPQTSRFTWQRRRRPAFSHGRYAR